ncbi:helix-turn-helix transcriptional regulator [Streptomyces sp. NPDC047042]|uniref:helix-turn-helix transcriptional regulator n=1 Tax=Streptomyces sp. NPDC047042 TaxID=3154807 RepID=UPI00340278DC
MPSDPLWTSTQARTLIQRRAPGGLIRMGRVQRGWRQADLGGRLGCSAATVSRLETRSRVADLELLRQAAHTVGMPSHVLTEALGITGTGVLAATRVASDGPCDAEEDPMRRRTLLAAAGAAVPAHLLLGVDDALAGTPEPSGRTAPFDSQLADARALFDGGRHAELAGKLSGLLGDGHLAARSRTELGYARLSASYTLASQLLSKLGRYQQARLTADRGITYAGLSCSALVTAAAARELAIVLRHQDQPAAAQRLMLKAAADVESTGLTTSAQAAAYAQMLCTTSYTAAVAGDRHQALAMIEEAHRAGRRLPQQVPKGRLFPLTGAAVDLYAVGVHWALGDAGAALEAGRNLRPQQFATAERRSRMHTDLARAWWQLGKPEQTATELLAAVRVSPGEVRDRSSIRQIVTDLTARHPRTAGVRELTAVVSGAPGGQASHSPGGV